MSVDAPFRFECPHCQQRITVEGQVPEKGNCPNCGVGFEFESPKDSTVESVARTQGLVRDQDPMKMKNWVYFCLTVLLSATVSAVITRVVVKRESWTVVAGTEARNEFLRDMVAYEKQFADKWRAQEAERAAAEVGRMEKINAEENLRRAARTVPAGGQPPTSASDTNSSALRKLEETIIPTVDFRGATVQEALDFLQQRSGVKMNLNLSPGVIPGLGGPSVTQTRITLKLTNVPALEALKYVANLCNLEFTVSQESVDISLAK